MNAQKKQDLNKYNDPSLKKALIVSTFFHIGLFILTIVGVPLIHKPPVVLTPVSIELVDIAEVTRTTNVAPAKKEPEKLKKIEAPKPPDVKKPPPKSAPESKPEIPEPAIPEPMKPEEKKPDPKPEPKKEPEKKPEPKPKPKPKAPEPEKKDEKKQDEDFDSLLKNLTPEKPEPAAKENPDAKPVKDAQPAAGALAELGDRLTISELDAFRYQIAPCWNIPAGAEYAEDLSVEVRVIMNRDGTVQDTSILNMFRYNQDSAFRAAADAAVRALRNPMCSPLKLPPEKYDSWKQIVINFDPRDML